MNETLRALRDFAVTPLGLVILGVLGLLVLAIALVPLWHSLRNFLKGLLWALLVVAVVGLAAFALWLWLERRDPDPERREAIRRERIELVQQVETNLTARLTVGGETNDVRND